MDPTRTWLRPAEKAAQLEVELQFQGAQACTVVDDSELGFQLQIASTTVGLWFEFEPQAQWHGVQT